MLLLSRNMISATKAPHIIAATTDFCRRESDINDKKVLRDLRNLRSLDWTKTRRSSGTAGSFLKASDTGHGMRWYYKLSDFDAYKGIVGHECINEIIADRLLTLLQIPHLSYQLIHAEITIDGQDYITWLCRSADVKPHTTQVACFLLPASRQVPLSGFGLPLHHTAMAQHHAAAAASAALRLINVDKVQVLLLHTEGTFASSCCSTVSGRDFMSSRMKYRAPILQHAFRSQL